MKNKIMGGMKMKKETIIKNLKGGLIVSCQTEKGDVIHKDNQTVVMMAEAAQWAGAKAIRANNPVQIKAIAEKVDLPIIGLNKVCYEGTDEVIMTPTLEDAKRVYEAGAQIIALDARPLKKPDGELRCDLIPKIKKEIPDAMVWADIGTVKEAENAAALGADFVSPTCFKVAEENKGKTPPGWREFAEMCRKCGDKTICIMEGNIYTPEDAMKAIYLGAHAVVVGSAITRPHLIAKRFVDLMNGLQPEDDWRVEEIKWHGEITKL